MENLTEQLENIIKAGSRSTNLSNTDFHGSQAVIPCTLVDSSTGIVMGCLFYKSSTYCGSTSTKKKISIVPISCGSDEVKSKSGKGSVVVENVTEAGKGEPDFHGFQVVILEGRKGETLYQATDVRSLDAKSNTASDRDLGGTRLVVKYSGSEPGLYLESGQGETFQSTELGILESEFNYSTARSLCSTPLVAKFTGSQPGIKHLAAGEDGHLVGGNVVVEEVIPFSGKDSGWAVSESNTRQDDGSKTTTTDSGWAESESNTHQDDGSTAAATVLGGGFTATTEGEGVSSQKTKIGIADLESNIHLDDGSTSIDKGFLVSENHTCLGLSITADGILMGIDSRGSPAVKSKADKGGSQALLLLLILKELILKVLISKVFKGGSQALILKEPILKELISKVFKDYLRLGRNAYLHLHCSTTEESISVRNGLSVSPIPTVIPTSGEVQLASMECLPLDIVEDILSRVPAESVLGCKLVCKKWVTLIRGSNFANMHLTHQLNKLYCDGDDGNDNLAAKGEPCLFFACQIDDPDEFISLLFHGGQLSDRFGTDKKYIYNQNLKRIYHPPMHNQLLCNHLVGSCNGLICAFQQHNLVIDPIYICNPLTREHVYLPQLVVKPEDLNPYDPDRIEEGEVDMLYHTACGFGYVRSTNEYKVVRIHYLKYEEGDVQVYTLGSGLGWRSIGKVPYRLDTMRGGRGTHTNDAIYWISGTKIVAFDLDKEEFRLLTSPPCMQIIRHEYRYGLVAFGRHLCLYMDRLRLEVWALIKSSDSKETWHKEFDVDYEAVVGTFSHKRTFQPILVTKGGEIVFLYDRSVLYCYDTKTTLLRMLSDESTDHFEAVEAIAHINTFASLESMGENSERYTVRPCMVPLDDVMANLSRVDEEIDTTPFRFRS